MSDIDKDAPEQRRRSFNETKVDYAAVAHLLRGRKLSPPPPSEMRKIAGFENNAVENIDVYLFVYANHIAAEQGEEAVEELLIRWEVPEADWQRFSDIRREIRDQSL